MKCAFIFRMRVSLILEFPWRVLDNIQGLPSPSGMPVIISIPISEHYSRRVKKKPLEKRKKGAIWIGANIESRSNVVRLKTPPMQALAHCWLWLNQYAMVFRQFVWTSIKGDFGTNEANSYLLEMMIPVSSTSTSPPMYTVVLVRCKPLVHRASYIQCTCVSHASNSKFNRTAPKGNTLNPAGAISAELIVSSGGLKERTGFTKLQCIGIWFH